MSAGRLKIAVSLRNVVAVGVTDVDGIDVSDGTKLPKIARSISARKRMHIV